MRALHGEEEPPTDCQKDTQRPAPLRGKKRLIQKDRGSEG